MRPLVMGVLNVTPDSFSDGGRWLDPEAAVAHGLRMVAEGADVIDVGAESTRPGAEPVTVDEELRRIVPVVRALAGQTRVSIDTRKAEVAEAAIAAGATLVNDVSASLAPVAAAGGVGWVAMHMQGDPRTMQQAPAYDDVVAEVTAFLVEHASSAGVDEVWIDPGIGFGKTLAHNLALLAHIDALVATGYPVVIGTSRKRFLGTLLAVADALPPGETVSVGDRLEGSVATAAWAMWHGAGMVRAHDVRASVLTAEMVGQAHDERSRGT
ncbi:MAG: dihydropteroate synthase [Acidimicrobiales bacterium]